MVSDEEMVKTIADFLEQGLAANIVSMFKADTSYYPLIGEVLKDERFAVRIGVSVIFEELAVIRPEEVQLAIPALKPLLDPQVPAYIRGEAVSILGLINCPESLALIAHLINDADPQVAEIARDPLLSDLTILRLAIGTNFSLSERDAQRLAELMPLGEQPDLEAS